MRTLQALTAAALRRISDVALQTALKLEPAVPQPLHSLKCQPGVCQIARLQSELGAAVQYIPVRTSTDNCVSGTTATESMPTMPAKAITFLEEVIEDAYREEMRRLMAGAVQARSPEHHREWLSTAQQLLSLRQSALAWHATQKTAGLEPTAQQSSAE